MSAGIKDVAAEAGVSVGTVSNVLNRPDIVAPATRDRVMAAIARLGFVRNESARQLRAGRSRTLGLVVLDVANPFFIDVAQGAEAVADVNDVMVMLCNSGQDPAREARQLDMLQQQRVLGILITPIDQGSTARLDDLTRGGIPVVLVDRAADGNRCSVAVDDVLGGQLAVAHLLDQGHTRIAFVGGGPTAIRQVTDRREGAEKALAAAGAPRPLTVVETADLTVAAGRAAVEHVMSLPASRRPTAVFCANDLLALGVLQELTRRSLRVPDDMAVVGYDDIEFASAAAVPLSSVRQPRHLLGRTAAELMLEEVQDGEHEHRQVVFEPELVIRESSARKRGRRRSGAAGTRPPAAAR